jgi:EAL domain-containing protein (putative c-di-GMP-specific phosphodiesterase class I)/ActR/RegA family two-component response regulator
VNAAITQAHATGLHSRQVLVVDDDPFQRELIAELIAQMGVHDVVLAADGREALHSLEHSRPDVVICDLDMAGMDGIELLRHIAERHFDGSVILMSGASSQVLATAGDLAHLHGLRLLATLQKPVDTALLEGLLISLQPAVENRTGATAAPANELPVLTGADLREGIAAGRVDVYVQPKVTVVGRRVVGAEALLRWVDDSGAIVPPMAVIAAAHEHGLVNELTMAVFTAAVGHLVEWQHEGQDLRISVNLSNEDLLSLPLPDAMSAAAQAAGIDATRITLEITQAGLLDDLSTGIEVVSRLRLKGFGIAIDDYGMGYSTLAQLKNLPVTELKVDRAFVDGAHLDTTLSEILGSSATLGRSLGLAVVAQGVETPEVMHLLEALGCDEVQGYLVAHPMPAAHFLAWKQRWDATWSGGIDGNDRS